MTRMTGLVNHFQQRKVIEVPHLNRFIKATSYKMFTVWTKGDMVDGIEVCHDLLLEFVFFAGSSNFQPGITRSA